jgi:hypothetical protein
MAAAAATSSLAKDWLTPRGGRSLGRFVSSDVIVLNIPFSDLS